MRTSLQSLWRYPIVRGLVTVFGLVLLVYFFYKTRSVWLVVLIAYTLAYLSYPLVQGLTRLKFPRWFAVALVLLMVIAFLTFIPIMAVQLVLQLSQHLESLPGLVNKVQDIPENLTHSLPITFYSWADDILRSLNTFYASLSEKLVAWLELNSDNVIRGLIGIFGGLFQVVLVVTILAYFLYSFPTVYRTLITLIPPRNRKFSHDLIRKLDSSVGGYFRGQLLVSLVVSVIILIGFLSLRMPMAISLAGLAFIANLIPFFGPLIVGIPAVLLALTQGPWLAFAAFTILLIVNQLDGHIISPWIFSRTMRLSPVLIIISLLLGTKLMGITGAILAVPLVAFIKLLYQDYYLHSEWYDKTVEELTPNPVPDTPTLSKA